MNCLSAVSGGAISYLRNLTPILSNIFDQSSEDHNLKLLIHESQRDLFPLIESSKCHCLKGKRPTGYSRIIWEKRNVPNLLHDENIDVIFVPYQISLPYKDVKQVLMIRNMEPFIFQNYKYSHLTWIRNHILRMQSKNSLNNADRVIAVSEFAKDFLIDELNFHADRIHKIYHGRSIDYSPGGDSEKDSEILNQLGINDEFLLTCGSLLPYRRCEDVIEAFYKCADSLNPGTKLVIAGSGTDKRYGRLISDLIANSPYSSRILSVGHVSQEIMSALYRNCRICIIASEIEACPNIAIEAMSSGCAIVSSDCRPLPEIFQNSSLEFQSRNIHSLVDQIRYCLENKQKVIEMKSRALKRADDFSWDYCAEETYNALTKW